MSDPHQEHITRHAIQLSEHYDAIQILATRLDPEGNTHYYRSGSGNLAARVEVARSFVRRADAQDKLDSLPRRDDDDNGEAWK